MADIENPDAPENALPDAGLPFGVEISPAVIDPGGEIVLTALIAAEHAVAVFHATAVFCLADGTEFGRSRLTDAPGGALRSEPVERVAPDEPGPHDYTVRLVAPDGSLQGEQAVTVTVAAHPIALTVWDVPPAIESGAPFRITLGLKCPCGCDAKGWGWRISDAGGQVMAEGTTGPEPWPGTQSLSWAGVDLTAPTRTGTQEWTVTALIPDHPVPHAERRVPLHLHVQPAPEVTLRITAIDVATGRPVPRARVVAHPYRAVTDADGVAELRLPKGVYTVFVSGPPYFAYKTTGNLTGDLSLTAEMHVDREFSDADAWS